MRVDNQCTGIHIACSHRAARFTTFYWLECCHFAYEDSSAIDAPSSSLRSHGLQTIFLCGEGNDPEHRRGRHNLHGKPGHKVKHGGSRKSMRKQFAHARLVVYPRTWSRVVSLSRGPGLALAAINFQPSSTTAEQSTRRTPDAMRISSRIRS
ncbi:hypothetical protein K491DRAFT_48291 [Lophiostoma macrostomum CBS 122681]|uniref:Uncharacterized protein n=1 Tax=Lophiostoma macrostomum CBS 122681 TaxID=1314788 RepID=A0A6A6SXJ9_9PLEO|nr:hypothetical protein K491DRAFT_48291 [Lophiostoma macrostomum CBS 122681]